MNDTQQIDFIGGGTFGEVWTFKINEDSPLLVQKISRRVTDVWSIIVEIICLSRLVSKYLPNLVYCGYTTDGRWCTIMQYFSGGTLDHHINEEIKRKQSNVGLHLTLAHKKYIAYHLALAIEFLHSKTFTHGYVFIIHFFIGVTFLFCFSVI